MCFFNLFPKPLLIVGISIWLAACGGSGGSDNDDNGNNGEVIVSTLAGDGTPGWLDATGTAAKFDRPMGVSTDGTVLYVADIDNNRVRRIVIATGEVSTFAGDGTPGSTDGIGELGQLSGPNGVISDGTNLYASAGEAAIIRQIVTANRAVTTLTGGNGRGFLDGPANVAMFSDAGGMAIDGGNLYVADAGAHRIRRIVINSGEVSTFAGDGNQGALDDIGIAAQFNVPIDITTDGTNFYVADALNHQIRKIVIATGEVTTFAGDGTPGALDGTGINAQFNLPFGITTDGVNLYVADCENHRIRQIDIDTRVVTTLAGSSAGFADGNGSTSKFNGPRRITTDGTNLYVGDTDNHRIRQIRLP